MKVEPRGKFGGVKIHLDAEEAQVLLDNLGGLNDPGSLSKIDYKIKDSGEKTIVMLNIGLKMGYKIRDLLKDNPKLLEDRSQEEVIAILAKEAEKAKLQLERAEKGLDISKVDPKVLKAALLKHVPKS